MLYFKKTCSWVLQNSEICDYRFGGPGKIIHLDESVVAKRKYNRGRMIKEKGIFGGDQRERDFRRIKEKGIFGGKKPGFLEFVEDSGVETL